MEISPTRVSGAASMVEGSTARPKEDQGRGRKVTQVRGQSADGSTTDRSVGRQKQCECRHNCLSGRGISRSEFFKANFHFDRWNKRGRPFEPASSFPTSHPHSGGATQRSEGTMAVSAWANHGNENQYIIARRIQQIKSTIRSKDIENPKVAEHARPLQRDLGI